ncbi:MAG: hypothetical protein ACK4VO_04510 [Pseudobdellovibrio sp.]
MQIEELKKLWISCHLLYQNSSQARDVFHILVAKEGLSSDFLTFLKKLYFYFKKNDPVKSASLYFEFAKNELILWNKALQKCTSDEVFILMSVLAHDVNLIYLSEVMSVSETRIRYLLNQGIRKVIKNYNISFDSKKDLKLREYGQNDVTNLFIHEHFAEYCLNLSTNEVKRKIDNSSKELSRYDQIKNDILSFQNELSSLKIGDIFHEEVQILESSRLPQKKKSTQISRHKDKIIIIVVLLIFTVLMVIRPSFLKLDNINDNRKKIILDEVALKKNEIARTDLITNDLDETVSKVVQAEANPNKQETSLSEAKPVVSTSQTTSMQISKNVSSVVSQDVRINTKAEAKVINGVYKGEMTAQDWEIVSKLIKDKIVEIGGTKAGEVELGWIKNKKTSYYHFVFPADKFDTLITQFKKYGNLNYRFEPHPRKLPDGQKRFILEVHQGE